MAAFSRRHFLGAGAGALAAPRLSPAVAADEAAGAEVHGISAFGDLKYPADFKNFDYVNVAAPKGGMFSTIPSTARLQSVLPDLQLAQRLHPQG